jgi:uncharacterized heparinase superfamily protein
MSTPSLSHTYFASTLTAGSALTEATDGGYAVLSQSTTVTTVSAGTAVSATLTLPANSQIIAFYLDTVQDEVVGGGSATAINATIGTAAAGTQYLSATDVIGGGRIALSFTTAQLAAMQDINNNTSVVITVDPDGTISTTQGIYRLTVIYSMM